MTYFEPDFFKPFNFSQKQINDYFKNAVRNLEIARQDPFAEVRFTFAYQALIKAGIAMIAKTGGVRVRSIPGHHVKIFEKMSEILNDKDIASIGDVMRRKRNADLYSSAESITEKEANDYLKFVETVFKKIESEFRSRK